MTWIRLETAYAFDRDVRRSRCGPVWPHLLGRMKDVDDHVLSDNELDPWHVADVLMMDEADVAKRIEGAKAVGLLVRVEGGWQARNWAKYNGRTSADRMRRKRARDAAAGDVTSDRGDVTSAKSDVTTTACDVTSASQASQASHAVTSGARTPDTTTTTTTSLQDDLPPAPAAQAGEGLSLGLVDDPPPPPDHIVALNRWADLYEHPDDSTHRCLTSAIGKKRIQTARARIREYGFVAVCGVIDASKERPWNVDKGVQQFMSIMRPEMFERLHAFAADPKVRARELGEARKDSSPDGLPDRDNYSRPPGWGDSKQTPEEEAAEIAAPKVAGKGWGS